VKWKRALGELLLLSVLILAFNVQQTESLYPPPTEWTRTYGVIENHDEARSIIQTIDGGYAMLGFTQHWLTGWAYTEDFWLVKTDPSGNVEWNRTYGAPTCVHLESGTSVVQTDDGGYALAGYISTEGDPPSDYDFLLIKTDSLGSMEWNCTYGGADFDIALSVVQTSDGGYALAGYTNSFGAGSSDCWLVKTDAKGNLQWNRTYGGADYDFAYSMVLTSDDGYVLAGCTESYGAGNRDVWLIKTDSAGSMEWNQTYGGTNDDYGYSVVQTSDGGYAVAGTTLSFGAGEIDVWMVKTDSAGNAMWNQTYGGMQIDEAFSLVQASDDGYALLGRTNSFGACDYWLVKTDSTGIMEWSQTYGGPLGDIGKSVVQTVDGGYAMAGYSNYYINSSYAVVDFWLVKTCSGGDVNGDGTINVLDLTIVSFAYGNFEGEPNYNPDADLNSDGVVDMRDMAIVARNLGKPS